MHKRPKRSNFAHKNNTIAGISMRRPGLKALRTTIYTLSGIGYNVDEGLLVHLTDLLRNEEERLKQRRLDKMSDEELAAADRAKPRRLRVYRRDGSIIPGKKSIDVFIKAILESQATFEELSPIRVKKKPLVIKRTAGRKMKGYCILCDDNCIYRGCRTEEMVDILERIDEQRAMYWEIERY